MISTLSTIAAEGAGNFVDLDIHAWEWAALVLFIGVLLVVDLLLVHRKPHEIHFKEAAIESSIATPDARAEGFGDISKPRMALMASQVATAFNTKDRIDPDAIFNTSFLPSKAERDIFRK